MGNVFRSVLAAARAILQSKTVAAGTSDITVSPDSGYDGLSSVTVQPTPSQTKSVNPTRAAQTVSPDSGKLLSSVSVGGIPSEYIIPSGAKSITANGTGIDVSSYATANVNVPNPTLSGDATAADVMNGKTFYNNSYTKQTGSYVAPTIMSITPSNSSPVSMSANSNYKPTAAGYAISSYSSTSKTPSSTGEYFSSGWNRMTSAGYAYSSKPQMTETTLWTNSDPTVNFTANDVTLSDSIANYDYIKISYTLMTSQSTIYSTIYPASDVMAWRTGSTASGDYKPEGILAGRSSGNYKREIFYISNTKLHFNNGTGINSTTGDARMLIPTKISGLKY